MIWEEGRGREGGNEVKRWLRAQEGWRERKGNVRIRRSCGFHVLMGVHLYVEER